MKKFVTEAYDAKEDAHYSGDLRVMLKNVPMKTVNERYSVQMEDVRTWVLAGIIEEVSVSKSRSNELKVLDIGNSRTATNTNFPTSPLKTPSLSLAPSIWPHVRLASLVLGHVRPEVR